MTRSEVEVAIIGGGAAGVGAARVLREAGVDALIVEARDRLGGRGWTVEAPGVGPLDLGCAWLHSGDVNPWTEIAERDGLTIDRTPAPWSRRGVQRHFSAVEQADYEREREAFEERLAALAHTNPDVAAAEALDPNSRWNGLMEAISTYVSGAELEKVSAFDLWAYVDTGVNWRVVEGYGRAIVGHGRDLGLALECPVRRIDHSGRKIRIETERGDILADQAIVTLPTSLIGEEAMTFFPALPEKIAAARALPLGLDDKLYMALDGAEAFEVNSHVMGRVDDAATAAYHLRPLGMPVVEAYFGGALAAELERGGEAAFFAFASAELARIFGADIVGRLKPVAHHGWLADPFARGSYSYARPGEAAQRQVLAAPVDGRLFFAGEACSERDYSTAHGALRTGQAAARAVIAARS